MEIQEVETTVLEYARKIKHTPIETPQITPPHVQKRPILTHNRQTKVVLGNPRWEVVFKARNDETAQEVILSMIVQAPGGRFYVPPDKVKIIPLPSV